MARQMRVPALELIQGSGRRLYCFAINGKKLGNVAAVSRVRRNGDRSLEGYQRPEVLSHIAEIRKYLESPKAFLPNAIVVAFDETVRFVASRGRRVRGAMSRNGVLSIPVPRSGADADKPGWIVDGQQRLAAIRGADLSAFPVFVVGFLAQSDEDQREQFILVNATKPLPKGLIYELLPVTNTRLPTALAKRRFPAALLQCLNYDSDSPFRGMIQTPTSPDGMIKDNSVLKMLGNSLSNGFLYWKRDPSTGGGDPAVMLPAVKEFWWAVRECLPGRLGVEAAAVALDAWRWNCERGHAHGRDR